LKYANRRSPRYPGVFQRCWQDCPTDRCRKHTWSFTLEVTINGTRRQLGRSGFDSASAAAKTRDELQHRHRQRTLPADMAITVEQYLRQWLTGKIKRKEIDENTQLNYRHHIETHLTPRLGRLRLQDLRGRHLTEAYHHIVEQRQAEIAIAEEARAARIAEIEQDNRQRQAAGKKRMRSTTHSVGAVPRPIGRKTLQNIHGTMRAALRAALADELIVRDVSKGARVPKPDRRKTVPPDIAQFWTLLDQARDHRLYPLMLLAGNSGLRRGELAGLRWSDLDLATGQLVVRQQRKSISYRVVESEAKSDAGQDRVVMLGERTIIGLKAWQAQQEAERLDWGPAYHDNGYVFTWQDGRPYHPDYLSKTVTKLMRRAGIADARLHNLRHFFAAVLISAGYDIDAVSKALGHSSVAITSLIYTSLFNAAKAQMATKAEDLVWKDRAA
jgi:integrase